MKKYSRLFFFIFSFGVLTTYAQNWKITESDKSIILIGEGWIKMLQGTDGYQEGEPSEYNDSMYEESEEETITMYNSAKNRIVMINEANQTYAEGTLEAYCDAVKSMREGMSEEMLQNIIKQQNAMPVPKVIVTKEKGESIMDYATMKYSIESDSGFFEEKWITNDPDLKEITEAYREMLEFSSRLVACAVPDESFLRSDPEFSEAYKAVQQAGFELRSNRYEEEGSESSSEVISIEKGVVSASEFDMPEGYTKRSLREFMMNM